MFLSETKRQHWVSQAEQRLNAIDPSEKRKSQRIHAFDVTDHDVPVLRVRDPLGEEIKTSLACADLFSFDVIDSKYRNNLETLFQGYEQDIARLSLSLLEKIARVQNTGVQENVKDEIIDLFAAKLLNFFRNPHCVRKALNTFGHVANYSPTEPQLLEVYGRVLSGSRPHEAGVCSRFGLTPELYQRWLRALFLMLFRAPGARQNLFEGLIKELFESKHVFIFIHHYSDPGDDNICLLSDRGFNAPLPAHAEDTLALDFNICARAFASFVFCDPAKHVAKHVPSDTPPMLVAALSESLKANARVVPVANDLEALAKYNQVTACQCAETVYAARLSPRL